MGASVSTLHWQKHKNDHEHSTGTKLVHATHKGREVRSRDVSLNYLSWKTGQKRDIL